MAWTSDFLDAISADVVRPRFLLESVVCGDSASPFGGVLKLSSFPATGYVHALSPQASSISYGRLQPGDWSRTHGAWSIGVQPSYDPRADTARGQVVVLRMGFSGWSVAEFEDVAVGVVRGLDWRNGMWVLRVVELVGALTSRFTSDPSNGALFHSLTQSTLGAAYTAGALQITVNNGSSFEQSSAGGGEGYLLLVTPTSGSPFYLRATTRVGDVFSGLTRNLYGTTDADAANGNTCKEIAYTKSHPMNIARRILTSTGTNGSNGTRDVLPQGWAYGIPTSLVDENDIEAFQLERNNSADWDLFEDESQTDGLSWLQTFLQPAGMFLATHQGRVTVRAIVDPENADTPGTVDIDDDDIEELEYSTWDDDCPVEYARHFTKNGSGSFDLALSELNTTDLHTRPVRTSIRRTLPWDWVGTSTWVDDVNTHAGPWSTRVPERIDLTLRGWRCGRASMGDVVRFSTRFLSSRHADIGYGFDLRRCVVLGGGADWFGSRTHLTLGVLPPTRTAG